MNDDELLLARIVADPADDAVRLVYADWLQENGADERAEFVRVQVELARTPACRAHVGLTRGMPKSGRHVPGACRYCDLLTRERDLLRSEALAPQFDVPGLALGSADGDVRWVHHDGTLAVVVRRGFPEGVTCTAADWLRHGDAIRAAQPVTRVVLTTRPYVEVDESGGYVIIGDPREVFVPVDAVRELTAGGWYASHERILAFRWPGVRFEVPPASATNTGLYENAAHPPA